eukprot:scaffold16556_cov133-Isochrysis_galbana.AAC.9
MPDAALKPKRVGRAQERPLLPRPAPGSPGPHPHTHTPRVRHPAEASAGSTGSLGPGTASALPAGDGQCWRRGGRCGGGRLRVPR